MSRIYYRNYQMFYSSILRWTFVFFLCTNAVLFYYLYNRNEGMCMKEGPCRTDIKSKKILKEKWKQTLYFKELLENFRRIGDEWRLISPFNSTIHMTDELNCSSLRSIRDLKFIAAGWTKKAFKVDINQKIVSMKVVNIDGHDMSQCMFQGGKYRYDCYLTAALKLLREISVLRKMAHPNVIKVLGYCVPVDPSMDNLHHTVAIFEEYGEPINVIKMLQLPWEDRLKISLGLSRLLKHLASFKEPIALNDFRRQQFVVIEGELKLIDVDDVGLQEPACNNTPCCLSISTISNKTTCLSCVNNACQGYNEKMNILKTGAHFIQHILPHGAPSNLKAATLKISSAFEFASLNSGDILKEMESLVTLFKNGWYRNTSTNFLSEDHMLKFHITIAAYEKNETQRQYQRQSWMIAQDIRNREERNLESYWSRSSYKVYNQMDLPSDFDYRCKLTAFSYGCMMSVSSSEEAADICMTDLDCKAFVITNILTWTGRRIVLFKNGIGNFIDNNETTLFVKQ